MSDIKFGCPNCGSEWKHLAGMTFGDVLSLRHDKERLTLQVTCLRADLAAVTAERDALAARLAPVDDEALVERDDFAEQIALRSENGISKDLQEFLQKFKEDDSAAIRMFAQYRDLEIEMDSWKSLWEKTNAHMRQVEAERDALAARLAPVDDEALVEIAMQAAYKAEYGEDMSIERAETNFVESIYKPIITAAIAAVRPHIEAAEREKLREDIKPRFSPKSAQQIRDETDQLIKKHRESVSDWLESGSWKQSGARNE